MTTGTRLTGAMFLGSRRVHGGEPTLRGRDPRSGTALEPEYGTSQPDQVDEAAELAGTAFRSFRETTGSRRAALLETIAWRLDHLCEVLLPRAVAETGIPEQRLRAELARTTGQLRMFADLIRDDAHLGLHVEHAQPARLPLPRPDLRRRNVPIGPVAVFGASNFPLAFSVAGGDTASALAAGCPVVVKAHPSHPGTSEIVAGAVAAAVRDLGLADGVFSMVYGTANTGQRLVAHPAMKAVAFTGSRAGGLAIAAAADARPVPIPVYAEMSSVNPVFLLRGALDERGQLAGDEFVQSLTTGTGQLCTNPGLIFALETPGLERFLQAVSAAVTAVLAAPMLSEHIRAAYELGIRSLREHPQTTELAAGTAAPAIVESGVAHVFTTTADAWLRDPVLAHEVFGPASLVVRVPDRSALPAIIERLEGQLTATIHIGPGDSDDARALLPLLEEKAGRIVVNGWPTGVEVGPATVHGGPFPATSDGRTTSVGTLAIERFLRPVAYQNVPQELLPEVLRDRFNAN
ncbi:aldehyde dehydrogenase (NADP(+)) [Dactylosporangium sp. CA-139066]|uniref:aldehyde dehydrogenase (NADP(+)) n=1 Tax=Dactylosporangium sp. CA-139066 TaxID=3239930 RepID=UPI003D92E894